MLGYAKVVSSNLTRGIFLFYFCGGVVFIIGVKGNVS